MTADFKSKKPALNGTTHTPPAQEEYTVYSERCAGHFYLLLLYFIPSGVSWLWLFLFVKACLMYLNTMAKDERETKSKRMIRIR